MAFLFSATKALGGAASIGICYFRKVLRIHEPHEDSVGTAIKDENIWKIQRFSVNLQTQNKEKEVNYVINRREEKIREVLGSRKRG